MPKFSVKKPLTVFVAVLAILVLGVVAYLKMTPDLMPNMDFPYVVIVTTNPGASPETVEADITKPMEQSMATLNEIKHVTSSSQNSVSMVVLEFEQGVNIFDTAPAYNAGAAERILGETLEKMGVRKDVILSTKCGNDFVNGQYVSRV